MKKKHTLQGQPFVIWTFLDDLKQKKWQEASKGQLKFRKVKRGLTPLMLLFSPIFGKVDAVIFRYMNDRHGFSDAIYRLITELLICLAAKIRNIQIIWFAHNVDGESHNNFPRVTLLRRGNAGFFCDRVLVTDEDLIVEARSKLPYCKNKMIDTCTFGRLETQLYNKTKSAIPDHADLSKIPRDAEIYMASINNWMLKKKPEIDLLIDLAKRAIETKSRIRFIVAGPQVKYIIKNEPDLHTLLLSLPNTSIIEDRVELSELTRAGVCDMLIKSYDDLSLSLNLFYACTLGLGIISEKNTFMGEFVEKNKIGLSLQKDNYDIQEILQKCILIKKNESIRNGFFNTHSWENGSKSLTKPVIR